MNAVSQGAPGDTGGWHATFSPSSSERWLNCPGSMPLLERQPPRPGGTDARLGTAAHYLASRAFTYDKDAEFFRGEQIEAEGSVFIVDDDMIQAVQYYLDDVRRRIGPGDHFMFEQRVYFSETIGAEDQGGTSDAFILHAGCKRLTVEDYKHGMGVPVSAEENTQMGLYALGVLETFEAIVGDEIEEVNLVICQPRIDNLSEWTASREWLMALRERAREAVAKVQTAEIDLEIMGKIRPELFKVTEKGCRWCGLKSTCDAYRQFVADQVYGDFEILDKPGEVEVLGKPEPPSDAVKLGELFGVLDLVEGWCRGVRAEVERRIFAGMEVIGPDGQPMKLVEGKKGNRSWIDEATAIATIETVLGPDKVYKPPVVVSPSAVEKALGKERKAEYEDFFAPLVIQPPGAAKVALGSDSRPPFQPAAADGEFADLGDE